MATNSMDRRTFVKTVSAAIGTAALTSTAMGESAAEITDRRKRYAIVGVGDRSRMYQTAIEKTFKDHAVLVGICDTNEGRLKYAQKIANENGAPIPSAYKPNDFEKMIRETKPDAIIVTSMCSTHSDYIVRGMKAGVDVITEKPMTTTAEKVQQIPGCENRNAAALPGEF